MQAGRRADRQTDREVKQGRAGEAAVRRGEETHQRDRKKEKNVAPR